VLAFEKWQSLFHGTQKLICSHGEFKCSTATLGCYNPNTAGGMSGGPVISLRNPSEFVGVRKYIYWYLIANL
jgi:hypothetical protein